MRFVKRNLLDHLPLILMALFVIFSLSVLFGRWHGQFSNSEREPFLCVLMNQVTCSHGAASCAAVFSQRSLSCIPLHWPCFSQQRGPTPMRDSTTVIKVTIFSRVVLPRLDLEVSNWRNRTAQRSLSPEIITIDLIQPSALDLKMLSDEKCCVEFENCKLWYISQRWDSCISSLIWLAVWLFRLMAFVSFFFFAPVLFSLLHPSFITLSHSSAVIFLYWILSHGECSSGQVVWHDRTPVLWESSRSPVPCRCPCPSLILTMPSYNLSSTRTNHWYATGPQSSTRSHTGRGVSCGLSANLFQRKSLPGS